MNKRDQTNRNPTDPPSEAYATSSLYWTLTDADLRSLPAASDDERIIGILLALLLSGGRQRSSLFAILVFLGSSSSS